MFGPLLLQPRGWVSEEGWDSFLSLEASPRAEATDPSSPSAFSYRQYLHLEKGGHCGLSGPSPGCRLLGHSRIHAAPFQPALLVSPKLSLGTALPAGPAPFPPPDVQQIFP